MTAPPILDRKDRIASWDALRGLAILLIIFANISAFSTPYMQEIANMLRPNFTGADAWASSLTAVFVNGKWRSVLMILFGAGLALQYDRRLAAGTWPRAHLRRFGWLFAISLLHFVALWYGDILLCYALGGLFMAALLPMPTDLLIRMAKILGGLMLVVSAIGSLLCGLLVFIPEKEIAGFAADLSKEGSAEARIFTTGSYGEQVLFRVSDGVLTFAGTGMFVMMVVPLIVLGVIMVRTGVFAPTQNGQALRHRWMRWGLGWGIPMNLIALLSWNHGVPLALRAWVELVAGPILAIGIVALAAHVWCTGVGPIGRFLTPIGRMAMSCYLLQSVLGAFIFYSWGLGWYGKLQPAELAATALGTAAASALFAHAWMRFASMGPAEALWRWLSGDLKRAPRIGAGG